MSSTTVPLADIRSSDEDLVRAALDDRAMFGDIYERYRLPVYRFLRALGASDDQAADGTATTFERAIAGLERSGAGATPPAARSGTARPATR